MSESKSYVETTLPPAYRGEKYGQGWEWHTRAEGRAVFATRAECCRSAWRHWTATVLRGRTVRWYGETEGLNKTAWYRSDRSDVQVIRYFGDHAGLRYQGAMEVTMCRGVFHDVDEAMARFAALVLATEGMVAR